MAENVPVIAVSRARSARDRRRFRGVRRVSASCAWCGCTFSYNRQFGRPRRFCRHQHARAFNLARKVATRHYLGARVVRLCPPVVRCWMCTGDFRGGAALTSAELPFPNPQRSLPFTSEVRHGT